MGVVRRKATIGARLTRRARLSAVAAERVRKYVDRSANVPRIDPREPRPRAGWGQRW